MCYINSQLPEFKVNAYRKDKGFIQVSNEDLKGKWSILFFYPGDFTFVCPTELADLADHYAEFQALGVDIYSVSTDSHFVHKAWADVIETIRKIEYTMLADMTFELSAALGVLGEESGQAYRGTFLFNPVAVVVDDFADDGSGDEPVHLCQIDTGFGVSGAY